MAEHSLQHPETWVDQHGDYLYRYAISRVQDPALAEDLVQETFLAALKAREGFEGRSSERTWLTGILKHKIIDSYRKKSTRETPNDAEAFQRLVDELFDKVGDWQMGPAKWEVRPDELMERKAFWEVLNQCLSKLSTRLARIFTMREMDGLSTEEICKVLNVSATNCWVMLYRARMHLRRCLEIRWFDSESIGEN